MTAAHYVTIWCDGKQDGHDCGEYIEGDTTKSVRAVAGRGGDPASRWLVGLPGGRDLCPTHRDQRSASTRWGGPL